MLLTALQEDLLMQVASKLTAREVWDSLKVRFVSVDRMKSLRMVARYERLGATLDNAMMVTKLLDMVSDRMYAALPGIKQFWDIDAMAFEEALGRLKAFEEWMRWRGQGSER
ncbi:retrotransposon protein [Hordeum vulgare]|nr:retrotransposon protein [Hordeum vulgare]